MDTVTFMGKLQTTDVSKMIFVYEFATFATVRLCDGIVIFLGKRNEKPGGGWSLRPVSSFHSPPPLPSEGPSSFFSTSREPKPNERVWRGTVERQDVCFKQRSNRSTETVPRRCRRVRLGVYWRYFSMYNTSFTHSEVSAFRTMFKEPYVANGHVNKNPMSEYMVGLIRLLNTFIQNKHVTVVNGENTIFRAEQITTENSLPTRDARGFVIRIRWPRAPKVVSILAKILEHCRFAQHDYRANYPVFRRINICRYTSSYNKKTIFFFFISK